MRCKSGCVIGSLPLGGESGRSISSIKHPAHSAVKTQALGRLILLYSALLTIPLTTIRFPHVTPPNKSDNKDLEGKKKV